MQPTHVVIFTFSLSSPRTGPVVALTSSEFYTPYAANTAAADWSRRGDGFSAEVYATGAPL
jgi:hypothetical protein